MGYRPRSKNAGVLSAEVYLPSIDRDMEDIRKEVSKRIVNKAGDAKRWFDQKRKPPKLYMLEV